jgi:hypothetical protein
MKNSERIGRCRVHVTIICCGLAGCLWLTGCGETDIGGYSNEWLYPEKVSSVYVEMFDTASLRRGHEYRLTDAVAKRIEAETPYKIVSNRNRADTVLSGNINEASEAILVREEQTGQPLEKQFEMSAVVSWKNLKTGELLIDSKKASASATFSTFQDQGVEYASRLAANRLAERIVEMMQESW